MRQLLCMAAIAIAAIGGAAQAGEADCGEEYISKPDETVYHVASKAFGPGLHRQLLVNVLLYRHGQNGGVLAEGTAIEIPCAVNGGLELPKDYWSASTYQTAEITVLTAGYNQVSVASTRDVNSLYNALLEGLMGEGLLVASFATLGSREVAAYQPFPDDGGAKDVSFPWSKSDCADAQRRNEALCSSAIWSDPFFDLTSGVYVSQGGPESLAELGPEGLCISDQSRVAAMQSGLLSSRMLSRVSEGSSETCLASLRANAVAAVIVPDIAAAAENRLNRAAPRLQKIPGVAFSDTVHAVIDNRNPNARRILKRLNDGLEEIRISGDWYQIVHAELSKAYIN